MRYRYFVTFVSYDGAGRWSVGNEVLLRPTPIRPETAEADIDALLCALDRRYEGRHHTILWWHELGRERDA